MKISKSRKTYLLLVLVLAVFSSINVFLPQGTPVGQYELPASKPVVALVSFFIMGLVYGGIGYIGIILSEKLDFAQIWDKKVSNKQRFLIPAMIGIGIGIFFILSDLIFSQFHPFGTLPHPPFPTSIIASITAGIGEEIIFRLFFITFWLWLICSIIFKGKWLNTLFWVVTLYSAIAFSAGHIPSVMTSLGIDSFFQIPAPLTIEIFVLNSILSIFASYYFKKYGFLAAIGIHFWTDIVWHVIYGSAILGI